MDQQEPIIILAGLQRDGTAYQLDPLSKERLAARYPGVSPAPRLFVGYDTRSEFESLHGPMWPQIVSLLTGVSIDRLTRDLGRVVIQVPRSGRELEVRP